MYHAAYKIEPTADMFEKTTTISKTVCMKHKKYCFKYVRCEFGQLSGRYSSHQPG